MSDTELYTLIAFGIITNFIYSFLFGIYMSNNIGMDEMIRITGDKKQPMWMAYLVFIPFAKAFVTLYRTAVLQFLFLNRGLSHKDYWHYLTH